MTRYPSHRGHVILPRGEGWHVPDYMPEDADGIGLTQARRLIDEREDAGEPPLSPPSVTWDTTMGTQGSHGHLTIHCGQSAGPLGLERGDPVRVTIRRRKERCLNAWSSTITAPGGAATSATTRASWTAG